MTTKMVNVFVIMMLAFVGFAASGAAIDGSDYTNNPNPVSSDTNMEDVDMNILMENLKRVDYHRDSWYSSWSGISKGHVARSRLYLTKDDKKVFKDVTGKTVTKLHPFGRGRYVKQEDFVTRLPEMQDKASKWGADQRTLLRQVARATAKVNTTWHQYKAGIVARKAIETAATNVKRVVMVDVDSGRRTLTTRTDILRYGAFECVSMDIQGIDDCPEGLTEAGWKDTWVERGTNHHWHKVNGDDLQAAIVSARELKEEFCEAWDSLDVLQDRALSELDIRETIERLEQVDEHVNWNLVMDPNSWGFTGEHECYYLNKNGVSQSKLIEYIRDHLHAKFHYDQGVSIQVAVDSSPWDEEKFGRSEYALRRITQHNITDDCSLGSQVRTNTDNLPSEMERMCLDFPEAANMSAMSLEINIGVQTVGNQARNLKTYFDALHGTAYPLATPPGFPPIVVGPACSMHFHTGLFGMETHGLGDAKTKFQNLKALSRDEPERMFFVKWVTTILDNWVANIELFEGTMPFSRRNSIHFAAHMTNMHERLLAARAITEFARSMGRETTAELVKDEFACLIELRQEYARITGYDRENVSDNTRKQFDEWDGSDAPPTRLAKMVKTSLIKWDKVLFDQIGRARETSGDGGHYAGLNLNSFERRGTIEFRQFGQTNNWKSVLQTMVQLQSLIQVSKSGIPMTLTSTQYPNVVDKYGQLNGNGVSAMARLMTDSVQHTSAVKKFLDKQGITELAELSPDAVPSAILLNTDGAKNIMWRSGEQDSSFVDENASVTGLGLGLMGVVSVVAAISPLVAALTMVVGCGIGFYVNRNVLHKSGAIEDVADIQPRPPTNREVKGLLKAVPALASRGEQGFGIGKLHSDGRISACWEVRKAPVQVFNNYGGRKTSYMKKDSTNIPRQLGSLAMKALNGGYNLSRGDYDGLAYIYHTRYSTGGADDKLNAHPHFVGAPVESEIPIGIFGVHNGVIYNDREVMALLPKDFLKTIAPSLKGLEVDSRAIWACLALFGSDNDGIDKMAQLVDGSMRLLWFDKSERREGYPTRLHLWSNTPDLWIGLTRGPEGGIPNVVGASTLSMLKETWGDSLIHHFEAELFHHYVIDWQIGDNGVVDLGACGVVDHGYGANDWQGGSSGKSNKPATTPKPKITKTNTKPSSVMKQLNAPGVYRTHMTQPVDPNFDGDCAHCEDGDLLYGSIEECPECLLTLDQVVDDHYASLGASCSVTASCSSPTKATPEAVEDLGLGQLFPQVLPESSRIPPVGSSKLKKYVADANKSDKTKTNHPVDICVACNRPPESCDADPCKVETARRSRELGVGVVHDQKAKMTNPQQLGFVVMRKCDNDLCCGMEQPHERTGFDKTGASDFECMGPCGWSPTMGLPSQKLMDWIDNELAGGNTINLTALSDEAQAYVKAQMRLA